VPAFAGKADIRSIQSRFLAIALLLFAARRSAAPKGVWAHAASNETEIKRTLFDSNIALAHQHPATARKKRNAPQQPLWPVNGRNHTYCNSIVLRHTMRATTVRVRRQAKKLAFSVSRLPTGDPADAWHAAQA
jgi:hypothetical protein